MSQSEPIPITLTSIANGGAAIGQFEGKTYFVPYTIPGEVITARVTDDRGRFAFAQGETLLEASADRVMPRCPHFGANRCGGCLWQHMDYTAQIALKTDIVLDQLERVGGFESPPLEMAIPSPQQWGYRHEARLLPMPNGKLGFVSAADRHQGFVIEECHIITSELLGLLTQLDLDLPNLTQVILRDNGKGEMMVILSTSDDSPPSLEVDLPASVNFLLSDNEPFNLIGATHLIYTLHGKPYRVTAGCDFRANLPQIETLLTIIRNWLDLDGHELVLDLYAGVGLVSGMLAPHASLVTCVDAYPPAMTDAETNLAAYDHVNIIEGDVAEILSNIPDDESYDVVVLDPPQSGLDTAVIDALGEVLPRRMVYIGDDPATTARDLKRLCDRYAYHLDAVQPIDFEPQTPQIVTLVHLSR